ncbi:retrovirus-related pol polyprotein from transposon TNT 1-94 [Tanacetum coccineum]
MILKSNIKTDNGTEFRNTKLESFCNEKGISQNFSSPYTPEQNGVAERKNITLIEAARTMLNESVLFKHFWTKAVRIACYTQKRSIIVKRHDRTPYEIFKERIPDISYFHVFGCLVFIHNHKDHLGKLDAKANDGFFLGYSFYSKTFRVFNTTRQQLEETYYVTFDDSIEAIRQYQTNFDISYYVIPHGRLLTELTQEKHVPEVIALNEQDTPQTKNVKGSLDPPNTKETQENVQNEQINHQLTKETSGINTKILVSITESLALEVSQSHDTNQASTSSYLVAQDIWLKDQHIELVNIIGDPREGMLTRSMAAKLTAASASECLFTDFLSKIEPKKASKALKHPWWVDAMQEELKQFYKNKEEGIDYDETFVPVARMEAIRIFFAFATYMNFIPPGFESSEFPDYVCKLDKSLYGVKQAPRAWYETLSTFLIQNKFANERIDNTLFIYKSKEDILLVQVYVDDIIFGSTSYKLCKQFEKLMTTKFKMSMIGELTYFLGLQIKQDDKGISICQEQYTKNLLKKCEFFYCSSVKTPMVPLNNLGPDLTVLCVRYHSNPKESHLIDVKRILKYLNGTPNLGLYYPKGSGFDLKGYSYSDYDGCNMDRKSTSAEVEYIVAAGCCASILWMKSQLSDYDIHYKMVPIFCDNTSAIAISNNPILHSRTKHIDLRYHFIRDHILKGDIELHFIPTEYQLVDIFTKPLDEPTFTRLKAELGMLNMD